MGQMGQNFHCIAGRRFFIPAKKVRNVKTQRYENEKPVIYAIRTSETRRVQHRNRRIQIADRMVV